VVYFYLMNPEQIINKESAAEMEVRQKIELIKGLSLDEFDKANLILTLLNVKPSSHVDFHRGRVSEPTGFEEILKKCGLYFEREVEYRRYHPDVIDHTADYFISSDFKKAQELHEAWNADNDIVAGIALGFPKTAVLAYAKERNKLLTMEETDFLKKKFKINIPFRVTKDNWREEIKVAEDWARALKQYAPRVYNEIIKDL